MDADGTLGQIKMPRQYRTLQRNVRKDAHIWPHFGGSEAHPFRSLEAGLSARVRL